jgi:DNA-damage-inducible protein D
LPLHTNMENLNLIPFEDKEIRKTWHQGEWYFAILDVLEVLSNTKNPKQYWKDLKKRDPELDKGGVKISTLLSIETAGGKQKLNCANTEGVLRIAMSVPSPKAEPLRKWLAQVGSERIQETENPELSFERMTEVYKLKGYTDEWITRRIESIKARKRLTDEWQKRGVQEGTEYSILTAVIAKGTFDLTPSDHKNVKGLEKPTQNLRDHMTPLELIFTALGEEVTRSLAIKEDAQGFNENLDMAQKGGNEAGKARKNLEKNTGLKVVSTENYLNLGKADDKKELPPAE